MFSVEELRDSINKVCVYSSISKKEAEVLLPYMTSDDKPLIAFEGFDKKTSNKRKIILTDKDFFFVTTGMFTSAKVEKVPVNFVQNIVERKGMLLSSVDFLFQNNSEILTLQSVNKESSSKLLTIWSNIKENEKEKKNTQKEAVSSEKIGQLEALFALKEKGAISEEEYNQEKSKLLSTSTNEPAKTSEEIMKNVFPSPSLPEKGKKKKANWIGYVVLLLIVFAFVTSNKDKSKDSEQRKDTEQQTTTASQTTEKSSVDLNSGKKMLTPSRQKGSKAFVKADGTKIFKEAELKNSLGELLKGTEIRIQEGLSSTEDLPVRYKVNVMKAGKVDISGWLTEDVLSNPVNIVTQQEKSTSKRLSLNNFLNRFNRAASNLKMGHNISKNTMKFTSGSVKDYYSMVYADCLSLSLFVVHGTSDFVEAGIFYFNDKTGSYSGHVLGLMGELFYATGVINDLSEAGTILNQLDFSNIKDGFSKSIIVNDWKVYISLNDILGFMCTVGKP